MSIKTMLFADIRRNKGAFFRILLFAFFLSLLFTVTFSFATNVNDRAAQVIEKTNIGHVQMYYFDHLPKESELQKVESLPKVKDIHVVDLLYCFDVNKVSVSNQKTKNLLLLQSYEPDKQPYPIFSSDRKGYVDSLVPNRGEIYLPLSFTTLFGSDIGDLLEIDTPHVKKTYRVAAFVEDIVLGNRMASGSKTVYLNPDDILELNELRDKYPEEIGLGKCVNFYRHETTEESSGLEDDRFSAYLGRESSIKNNAEILLTRSTFALYAAMSASMFAAIFMVFIVLLFLITWIVINFQITGSLEQGYTDLGVLKSLGFTSGKLACVYLCEYALALSGGFALGFTLAFHILPRFTSNTLDFLGMLPKSTLHATPVLLALFSLFAVTMLFILFKMRKLATIRPLRAIAGGHSEIYFKPRLIVSLGNPCFSLRLALRQLLSNVKSYVGSVVVISLLVFFILTVSSTFAAVNPDTMLIDYYGFDFDLNITYLEEDISETQKEIEDKISSISPIVSRQSVSDVSFTHDGLSLYGMVVAEGTPISSLLDGRPPKYENEVVLTKIYADKQNIAIGDTVKIKHDETEREMMVSGFFQNVTSGGFSLVMTEEAFRHYRPDWKSNGFNYKLQDSDRAKEIAEKFGKDYAGKTANIISNAEIAESLGAISDAAVPATVGIYAFAMIFVLMTSQMLAQKLFQREQQEYGIYKAVGMATGLLRRIFVLRLAVSALIGSGLGVLFTRLFSNAVLSKIMVMMGINRFNSNLTPAQIIAPVVLMTLAFALFASLASLKIKRVRVRALVND